MMDEERTERLQELLRKLGKAVHASVVRSEDVRECLHQLHEDGWQAVMMLEASLACGDDGSLEVERGTLRLHVNGDISDPEYRMDVADARFLHSLGISSGRHRSNGTTIVRRQPERDNKNECP